MAVNLCPSIWKWSSCTSGGIPFARRSQSVTQPDTTAAKSCVAGVYQVHRTLCPDKNIVDMQLYQFTGRPGCFTTDIHIIPDIR
jgi:hypothetical protein